MDRREESAHIVSDSESAEFKSCLRAPNVAKPIVRYIRFQTSVKVMAYPTQCELANDVKVYVPLLTPSEWNVERIPV